ncbi:MAG: anti-sigma factor domain-containing protein [Acidimicrobiales bacterium]
MSTPRTHAEIEELLGAFALDAVDSEEREVIERHLVDCPRCRAEVAEHREVAAMLANTGSPAPEGLWERIADAIEGGGEPVPAIRLDVRRSRRPPALPWLVIAAAAVVAFVLIGALALQNRRLASEIDDVRAEHALEAAANRAVADPDSRMASLRAADGALQAVTVVVQPDGQGYLLGDGLPPLEDRLYQLWGAIPGGEVVSLGVLGREPAVAAFRADPAMSTIMVSVEAEPVQAPSGPPVLSGQLS